MDTLERLAGYLAIAGGAITAILVAIVAYVVIGYAAVRSPARLPA